MAAVAVATTLLVSLILTRLKTQEVIRIDTPIDCVTQISQVSLTKAPALSIPSPENIPPALIDDRRSLRIL